MDALNFELLLRILVAHFLSDFIFQRKTWAEKKDSLGVVSGYFWLHIAITTITLSVLLWDLKLWPVIVWVTVGHLMLDAIKSELTNKGVWIFLADQLLHLSFIVIIWLVYSNQVFLFCQAVCELVNNQKFWCMFLAYILISIPSSVLIDKITRKWSHELDKTEPEKGLENAGKWIGIMERFLIITFLITNNFGAIGFLLAAKSVFRFGDLQNASARKKTEYIIIGTFLSFTIAIILGLVYKLIMQ